MTDLQKRIISALVLIPLLFAAVYFGTPYFELCCVAAVVFMAVEWEQMMRQKLSSYTVASAAFSVAALFFARQDPEMAFILTAAAACGLWILMRVKKEPRAIHMALGLLYIAVPLLCILFLQSCPGGWVYVMALFVIVWAMDTGGFLFGSLIGGPKLCPKISPKKTWAGFFGGFFLVACLLPAAAFLIEGAVPSDPGTLILAGSVGLAAVAGDLFESWIKRRLGLKDSGNLIPGHGGIFDRLDSLLLAAPVAALLVKLLSRADSMEVFAR